MLTNINERTLSKNYNTKIRSFPGANVGVLFEYLKSRDARAQGKGRGQECTSYAVY